TSMTVPSTTSPFLMVLNDSSSICSKLNSDMFLNLLNYIIWGRSPCCNTYMTDRLKRLGFQINECLYIVSICTFFFAYFIQFLRVGAVFASYDNHGIHLRRQSGSFLLPLLGGTADCI